MELRNTDDFIKQVQADELADAEFLKPREYARLRGIAPQLVYYYIRQKKVQLLPCGGGCGCRVVSVKAVDDIRLEIENEYRKHRGLPALTSSERDATQTQEPPG
jgi:hypothetical protein